MSDSRTLDKALAGTWLAALCGAMVLLSGCRESPPAQPPAKPEIETVQRDPTVWARYAEPGENPRDGSSLVIELEVPLVPPALLAPSPPIVKEGGRR